ncbi:MAG: alpha/beta fold hydrolase [Halorientalis sp.]
MAATRRTISANGLEFECLARGDGDRLALCLHGFPDDPTTFEPLLDRLADAGFTAVAPYMRGYGPTGPAPDGEYSESALASDVVELATALTDEDDFEDVVVIGHDWGAVATYGAARRDPELFDRIVTMAVPPRFAAEIFDHPRQFLRSWYIWFFQLPGLAEQTVQRDDFALLEVLWNLWSPGWDYDSDHIESVKETFRTEGTVEAALSYYRQFVNPMIRQLVGSGRPDPDEMPEIEVPGLVIAGANDSCIGADLFTTADDAFAADCRVIQIRDAGHFMHCERPSVVGDEIESFLTE